MTRLSRFTCLTRSFGIGSSGVLPGVWSPERLEGKDSSTVWGRQRDRYVGVLQILFSIDFGPLSVPDSIGVQVGRESEEVTLLTHRRTENTLTHRVRMEGSLYPYE